MKRNLLFATMACLALVVAPAHAGFLVQVDTDGADDGPSTPSPNFTFGGDTTAASTSVKSVAPLLPEGDSLFGGNGDQLADTYVYRYDPTTDADNLVTSNTLLGVDLDGNPIGGSGLAGGPAGRYRVSAAWPATSNVSGGDTLYKITSGLNELSVLVNQNEANDPDGDDANDVWVALGEIEYDGSSGIIVEQSPSVTNSFVSMRSAAVLFERIPEPTSMVMACLAALGMFVTGRRR